MNADTTLVTPVTPEQPRWERYLTIGLLIPGAAMLVVMMVYTTANALSRTLLNHPLPASIEITQYWFLPVLATLGFVLAQLANQHVEADLFYTGFPPAAKKWLTFGIQAFMLVVLAAGVYFTLQEALYAMDKGIRAGYTPIPAWPAFFLVPLSFAGMIAVIAVQLKRTVQRSVESFANEEEALPGQPTEEVTAV